MALRVDSALVIPLPLTRYHTALAGPDSTVSLPLLPVLMWLFPYILSCRNSVLLVFRSFSVIAVSYVAVVWGCCGRG